MKEKPTPHEMNANMLVQTSSGVYEPAGDVIAQRDEAIRQLKALAVQIESAGMIVPPGVTAVLEPFTEEQSDAPVGHYVACRS